MALRDLRANLLAAISTKKGYLAHNEESLDIYNGNLQPYVDKILKQTLSDNYYNKIKHRSVPINILKRYADKTSKAYETAPQRLTDAKYQQTINYYTRSLSLNMVMNKADDYSTLFKGYLLEPYIHMGKPKARIIPYDRFLPYSTDEVDPTYPTVIVKFMGKKSITVKGKAQVRDIYFSYSNEEFDAFDDQGDDFLDALQLNDGVNPLGRIPFVYGNRGNDELIPTQDTDLLQFTKLMPILMTDLSGAIMFQCFTIIYGVNVSSENLTMSPNAFWSLKSDPTTQQAPIVGTIKPDVDVDKVINYIMNAFSFWLETKGIRTGSVGQVNANNVISGISKLIDEMDATSLIMRSQVKFSHDEMDLWDLIRMYNNLWLQTGQITTKEKPILMPDDLEVTTQFDEPQPVTDRRTEVETARLEVESGFTSRRSAMVRLYPNMSSDQIDQEIQQIDNESTVIG